MTEQAKAKVIDALIAATPDDLYDILSVVSTFLPCQFLHELPSYFAQLIEDVEIVRASQERLRQAEKEKRREIGKKLMTVYPTDYLKQTCDQFMNDRGCTSCPLRIEAGTTECPFDSFSSPPCKWGSHKRIAVTEHERAELQLLLALYSGTKKALFVRGETGKGRLVLFSDEGRTTIHTGPDFLPSLPFGVYDLRKMFC